MRRHALILEPYGRGDGEERFGKWQARCRCGDWSKDDVVDLNSAGVWFLHHATAWPFRGQRSEVREREGA